MVEESSFKRRKFTLTEHLDEELQRIADQHYDGNVSLCLRSAISEHESTLSGEGRRALQRVEREVSRIDRRTTILVDEIGDWISAMERNQTDQSPTLPFKTDGDRMKSAALVHQEFLDSNEALRLADVIERAELSPQRVLQALEVLLDTAHITRTSNGRYRLLSQPQQRGRQ